VSQAFKSVFYESTFRRELDFAFGSSPSIALLSRIVDPEANREDFFGVNADAEYLADWIDVLISQQER